MRDEENDRRSNETSGNARISKGASETQRYDGYGRNTDEPKRMQLAEYNLG